MNATELQKLLVKEVSGVDDPANEIPGWMVQKASKFKSSLPIGPDDAWDVAAAEKRVRTATKAEAGPNPAYAACFLWYDGSASDDDGDGVPDTFGDYKFLVVDDVDGKLQVMPAAIRAAASRLPGSSLPAADKTSVGDTVAALEKKAGIGEDAKKSKLAEDATPNPIVHKLKDLFGLGTGKDADDMNADELNKALDDRDAKLLVSIGELVAKSVAPAEVAPAAAPAAVAPVAEAPGITAESVQAAIEAGLTKALEPYNTILENILVRQEGVEKAFGIAAKSSLDGQEGAETDAEKSNGKPVAKASVSSAIAKALQNPGKPVFLAGQTSGAAAAL